MMPRMRPKTSCFLLQYIQHADQEFTMPKLPWGRTLETCVKRKMNALLMANQPPYWRSHAGLYAGLVPSLDPEDILSMLDEIAPTLESGRIESLPGCRSFRLIYGIDKFRV